MAQVWKAWDPELERFVALKIIREGTEQEQKRFVVEARSAGALNHPNITGVHDFGEDEGFSYIAFDYIDGSTSWDLEPDIQRTVEIVRDSALAVQHAHDKGIIHRDIKPSNIMISKAGQTYVTDFGLARRISSREQLTVSGASIGTPSFMSPEQAEGRSHQVDGTTDVYSLGATLYALLTRRAPFDGDSAFMVMLQVIREDPPLPTEIRPEIGKDLETIILKCLEKLPKNRYATADDLANELNRYLDQEPIHAVPVPPLRRWARKIIRKKQPITIAVAILLFTFSLGLFLWNASPKPATTPEPAPVTAGEEFREKLGERLQTIGDQIQQLRYSYYIKNIDLSRQLRELRAGLEGLENSLDDQPADLAAPGWKMAGIGWYVYGHRTRSEAALLRAGNELPEDTEIRFHLGRIYLDRSRSTFLEEVAIPLEDARKSPSVWIAKAKKYFQQKEANREKAPGIDQDLIQLYLALTKGKKEWVRKEAEEGWKKNEKRLGSEEYWILMGMATTPDLAITDYTEAIERRPHYDTGYFLRGWSYAIVGNSENALEDLNMAIRINPRLSLAYHERAQIRAGKGLSEKALQDYNRTIELSPNFTNAYNNRGVFYFDRKQWTEAIQDFSRVIELEPTLGIPYSNRGEIYRIQGELEKAMEDCNLAIQYSSNHPTFYSNRGHVYFDREDYENAIQDYTQAIALAPNAAAFSYYRGLARFEFGSLEKALEDFSRALELNPDMANAHLYRARTHEGMEKWQEAVDDYQIATRIPANAAEAFSVSGYS